MEKEVNEAFIDGQNLYMGTTRNTQRSWQIDLTRLRVYLRAKYHVEKAYYFLGYVESAQEPLYESIQGAGFILLFRQHSSVLIGKKKGNVDAEIIF